MTGPTRRRRLYLVRRQTERRRSRARDRFLDQDLARLDQRIEQDLVRIRYLALAEHEHHQLAVQAAIDDVRALVDELGQLPSDIEPGSADAVLDRICHRLDWPRERLLEALLLAHALIDSSRQAQLEDSA